MHLEKPETIQRALEILAKAGGLLDSESFARQMWPPDHPGWKRVAGKKGKKLGGGLHRAAGSLLGRLRSRDWLVTKAGPKSWRLTEQGWNRFRAGVAAPPSRQVPVPKPAPVPVPAPTPAQGGLLGWAGGRWYPLRAATPYGKGWALVTWANGAQTVIPESGLRRQA